MQLGTSTIPLLPAVAVGVAVVLAGLVLWGVLRVRTSTGPPSRVDRRDRVQDADPGDRDWTGEIAAGAADPPAPPRPLTVAEAVAASRADTGPIAVVPRAAGPGPDAAGPEPGSADDTLAARRAGAGLHRATDEGPDVPGPAEPVARAERSPVEDAASTTTGASVLAGAGTADADRPPGARTDAVDDGAEEGRSTGEPAPGVDPAGTDDPVVPDELPVGVVPDLAEDADGLDVVDAAGTGTVPPPWSPARTAPGAGPSEPVSAAVQQALAARAVQRARTRPDDRDVADDDDPAPVADARDRLLSVLLTDPTTAVGAAGELDDTRARIDRLGDVLRRRRADLSSAVQRLHRSGLTGEQIGRLAGLDGDDVRTMLEQPSGECGGLNGPA